MRLVLMSILLAQAAAGAPAWGAAMTLTQVSPPATYRPAGRAIDVAGLVPGMSVEAARAVLTKVYDHVGVLEENLGLQDQGVDVATQNYVTRMTASKGTEDVSVWFGTPTTGNAVVEVTRQTIFADPATAPTMDEARAKLAATYGPPSFDGPATGTGEVRLMAWSYQGDKPVSCAASSCRADVVEGLSVGDLGAYRQAIRHGHELTIVGMILTGITDPSRAASMALTVSDTATKLRTLDEAINQMKAAAHPGQAPKKERAR